MRVLLFALSMLLVRPLAAQAPVEAPLIVSLAANGGGVAELRPGWPLLVRADLLHRDAYQEGVVPVTIQSGGSWAGAVRLVLRTAEGQPVAVGFHLSGAPSGALTLDAWTGGTLVWWLAPEETAALAPGGYTLEAVVDSTALGGGVRSPRAVPVRLMVRGADAPLTPAEAGRRQLLKADLHVLRGDAAAARSAVETLLSEQPGHPEALAYLGNLLLVAEDARGGAEALARASAAFEALDPDGKEPSAVAPGYYAAVAAFETATAFQVTVAPKGATHPYAGQGGDVGFAVDGFAGEELVLERGRTYTFRLAGVPPTHPFYLTTSAVGGGAAPYTDGVAGTPAVGDDVVTFTPGEATPDLLYYQCATHPMMGWRLHIRSAVGTDVGAEPAPVPGTTVALALGAASPNPFVRQTTFTLGLAQAQVVRVEVFDLLGRRVAALHDGWLAAGPAHTFTFDGSTLPSGVYVLRALGERGEASRTVALVR